MKVHEIKIHTDFFNDVIKFVKTFELRKNDRNYKTGDVLILREVVDNDLTGQYCTCRVKYMLKSYIALSNGYVALGIQLLDVHLLG